MRYVGNASLSEQIQERILTTFQQTLSLAEEGNRQEALLGCDFVLRLDPLFEPARQLQNRLSTGEGPIDIGDLAASVGSEETAAADATESGPPIATGIEPDLEPAAEAPPSDDLPSRMAMLLEQRDFESLQSLVNDHRDRIAADPTLQQIAESGIARLEAQPYVESFLESSVQAKDVGDLEQAQAHLDKARELDPSHPRIAALEADLAQSASTIVEEPEASPPATEQTTDDFAAETDWLDDLELTTDGEEPAAAATTGAEPETTAEPETEAEAAPGIDLEALESDLLPTEEGEPEAQLDSESEDRIGKLLAEGQEAFEKSEYQTAIDAWSRIFLIDIDHAEASRRIELARKLKAEVERQVEEAFHEGIELIEAGKKDEAKVAFEKVLEMHPGHMGAREYVERIESGDADTGADAATGSIPTLEPIDTEVADESESATTPALDEADLAADLAPEPVTVPTEPDLAVEYETSIARAPKKRSFALIGTAVLILALMAAWFLYSKRQSIFPNSDPSAQQADQPRTDPIERARELHEEGNTAMAVNVLRRLPPSHPQYAEGQSLIEAWEVVEAPVQAIDAGPSEDELLKRDDLLAQARSAASAGENLVALELLEQAETISPLENDELQIQAQAAENLEDLADEIDLFEQGDWEFALPSLWRLYDADESNRDVRRLMVDSYYNLGLRDLQRGDSRDAAEKFREALQLDPNDEQVQRLVEFADAYSIRPPDLLYRIFVKYHPFR